jgi:DnaJ-domain-containing protein 1
MRDMHQITNRNAFYPLIHFWMSKLSQLRMHLVNISASLQTKLFLYLGLVSKPGKRRVLNDAPPCNTRRWSPYDVLGVSIGAKPSEIKIAYKNMSIQYHPDKNPHCVAKATEMFKMINNAYEVCARTCYWLSPSCMLAHVIVRY